MFKSLGLLELIILGGGMGLVLLIGAIIIGVIMKRRKTSTTPSTSRRWIWIIGIIVILTIVVPIGLMGLGVLLVTPVRQSTSPLVQGANSGEAVVIVESNPPGLTLSDLTVTPDSMPLVTPPSTSMVSFHPLDPVSPFWFVSLLAIAGLATIIIAIIITPILKHWRESMQSKNASDEQPAGRDRRIEKLRYGSLVFIFWVALSILIVLDFAFAVSIHLRVLIIYSAFWVLVGALLLHGRSIREKLLILSLLVVMLFTIRFINWNSRKAFLLDFDRIDQGMSVTRVEEIMGDYMRGGGAPLGSPETEINEKGEIINGVISYRHTNAGWGDSDWGVITFENSQVINKKFLPD